MDVIYKLRNGAWDMTRIRKRTKNKIMMCTKMNIECQAWYVKLAIFVPVMNWIRKKKLLECNEISEQRMQNCIKRGRINDFRYICGIYNKLSLSINC